MNDMSLTNQKRLVIVGGVAAGASCAARARRLDEAAQITVLERGPDVSFANCGLPYHIGGVIEREAPIHVSNVQLVVEVDGRRRLGVVRRSEPV